jgi:hypothetical protein
MGNPSRSVLWRDIVVGLAVFGLYLVVDALGGADRRAAADAHARTLYHAERGLRIDLERWLNRGLSGRQPWASLANYEYAVTYVISAFVLLFWMYRRRPADYARARDSFLLLNVLAIGCFAVYPVTPPRLLPALGFTDTVLHGRTWGSWGSPLVSGANQLAAIPSLHVGWSLWVSVVLARVAGGPIVQLVSAVHVAVTTYVILATGNHFVLDALAAVVFVWVSVRLVDHWYDRPPVVPPADAFFLHIEDAGAPQQVGGMVVFAPSPGGGPTAREVRELVRGELERLPRFGQRLELGGRWRRAHWVDAEIDWSWHVGEYLLDDEYPETEARVDAGCLLDAAAAPPWTAGIARAVGELVAVPLPRDRPLWRLMLVRDRRWGVVGMILLLHHTVADGIGTVVQALHLLRPTIDLTIGDRHEPGPGTAAVATAVGLAQLACDPLPGGRLPVGSTRRLFHVAPLDLRTVRAVAHTHDVRVTDVLLSVMTVALQRLRPDLAERLHGRIRVAVPLMVREPSSAAEGNLTAAVMIDVPLTDTAREDSAAMARLADIRERSARLHSGTRALASHFVMARGLRLLPEPAVGWFARSVYGGRFFHAIVSNMAGPDLAMTFAGAPIVQVFPILPPVPGVPLVAGVLSWHGVLGVGLSVDPAVLDGAAFADELPRVLDELGAATVGMDQGPAVGSGE